MQNLDSFYCVATVESLEILLLQQDVLHLELSILILQMLRQICQHIHCSGPVSLN